MGAKFLVFIMAAFILTSSVCASSLIITEDKKPVKASSVVNDGNKTKKEITRIAKDENIYISENMLYIKTPLINDLIYVYTASGLCIDKFVKETELVVKDASAYPAGVLIITNGKDLTTKVVK